jgi:hypothetical protein
MRSFSMPSALVALVLASGCAHMETTAVVLDSRGQATDREETRRGLALRCTMDNGLSDDSMRMLDVAIENKSRLPQNLAAITFSLPPQVANLVEVPAGDELKGWVEALKAKQAVPEERAAWILAPENHLFAAPVAVPPQACVRRFILVHLKKSVSPFAPFNLTLQYEEGPKETVQLPLNCEEPPTDKRNASFL